MSGATIKPEDRPGWRPRRNCLNCRWDRRGALGCHVCDAPDYSTVADDDTYGAVADWIVRNIVDSGRDDGMPPEDADGCPGWEPKERAENTDRAQRASLVDSATIRPDSATATVKDSSMVDLLADLTIEDAQHAVAEFNRVASAGFVGWRGNLPICRGPGGIQAKRLRALVRGVRR